MEREKGSGPGPSHWLRAADSSEVMGPKQLTSLRTRQRGLWSGSCVLEDPTYTCKTQRLFFFLALKKVFWKVSNWLSEGKVKEEEEWVEWATGRQQRGRRALRCGRGRWQESGKGDHSLCLCFCFKLKQQSMYRMCLGRWISPNHCTLSLSCLPLQ